MKQNQNFTSLLDPLDQWLTEKCTPGGIGGPFDLNYQNSLMVNQLTSNSEADKILASIEEKVEDGATYQEIFPDMKKAGTFLESANNSKEEYQNLENQRDKFEIEETSDELGRLLSVLGQLEFDIRQNYLDPEDKPKAEQNGFIIEILDHWIVIYPKSTDRPDQYMEIDYKEGHFDVFTDYEIIKTPDCGLIFPYYEN